MSVLGSTELINPKLWSKTLLGSVLYSFVSLTRLCIVGCEFGSLVLRTESSVVVACDG